MSPHTPHPHHPEHSGEAITIMKVEPIQHTGIVVTCRGQEVSGKLADRHSAYFDNISPPLDWTDVPEVKAWAVIVEDPDAPREKPFVHWMIWNIEGELLNLPEAAEQRRPDHAPGRDPGPQRHGRLRLVRAAAAGRPRRPPLLFPGVRPRRADRDGAGHAAGRLLNALKGHTLATGEMMATYEAPNPQ